MTMQGNQAGIAQVQEYAFVAAAGGQSRFVGADSKGFVLNYASGFLWAIVDGFWVSPDDFTATDGSSITFTSPVDQGTAVRLISIPPFNIANVYTQSQSDTQYAKRRNRIIDPGMRVSQEQGNNLLTLTNGTVLYPCDGFFVYRNGSTGGATAQRLALATPGGSPYRTRITVTAANATPSNTDQLVLNARIEGVDVADLKFGTASAKTVAIRFGCRVSVAGTYGVAVLNGAYNRSWVGTFSISPTEVGIDVVRSVSFAGDVTGSWSADNTLGLALNIGLLIGSAQQGVAGWQSTQAFGTSACSNLMATNGATFDLFDVGLYDVTGLQNGVIPPFELDSYTTDLLKCFRYLEINYDVIQQGATGNLLIPISFKTPKRVQPSISYASVSYGSASSLTTNYAGANSFGAQIQTTNTSGYAGFTWTANARL